jgi:uncharacterized membrane protein YgcG
MTSRYAHHVSRFVGTLLSVLCLLLSFPARAAETIPSFDVRATLSADRLLQIKESITYDFGGTEHHGIERFIPVVYDRSGAKYRLRLSVDDATVDGVPVQQSVSNQGSDIRIRLGDPDEYVTGRKTYVINYSTNRAINDFPNEQEKEFYWNVTGNGWDVAIDQASFVLEGPVPATKVICFTGYYGSTESDCRITQEGNTIRVTATRPFEAREGLTIAVRYPASALKDIPITQTLFDLLLDNVWLALPVLVFIIMFAIWQRHGKDPKGRGTVIAHYEEPRKLPPGLLDALLQQEFSSRAVTATILDLGRRGFLKLSFEGEPEKSGWFTKAPVFTLHKLKEANESLLAYEKTIFDGLFEDGDEVTIESKKDGSFWKAIQTARTEAFDELKTRGLFGKNPGVVRGVWFMVAFVVGASGFFLSDAFGSLFILSSVLSALIVIVFGWQMPRKTEEGAIVAEEAEGFRTFLSVTERDRLDFSDAPERRPDQFARFLPAAVAFGVEEKWAKQFAGIQVQPPSYMNGNTSGWTAASYAHAFHAFHDASVSGIYHNPSSGGSGGSGFSGGGSGGGMGGGGGGSW